MTEGMVKRRMLSYYFEQFLLNQLKNLHHKPKRKKCGSQAQASVVMARVSAVAGNVGHSLGGVYGSRVLECGTQHSASPNPKGKQNTQDRYCYSSKGEKLQEKIVALKPKHMLKGKAHNTKKPKAQERVKAQNVDHKPKPKAQGRVKSKKYVSFIKV